MTPFSVDHDNKVIGVPNEAPRSGAVLSAVGSLMFGPICSFHCRWKCSSSADRAMLAIGGDNWPPLRGSGVRLFPVSEFREDPGFQERLH